VSELTADDVRRIVREEIAAALQVAAQRSAYAEPPARKIRSDGTE
jgi:hypothetical protein